MKRKNPTTYTPPELDIHVIECEDILTNSPNDNSGNSDSNWDNDW